MPSLNFKGKNYVYSHHLSVPFRDLKIDGKKSKPAKGEKPNMDDNLIIQGDNLHALKALLPRYAGKIECIFIDPPYNTGEEGWCYNDKVNSPLMREWLEDNANPVDKEDLERHDKWLCMMWPRLQLLRELLAENGIIFITLDDNEAYRLQLILEEIFGEDNFIGNVAWKKTTGDNKPTFAYTHDNVIIFCKNKEGLPRIELSEEQKKQYKNPDSDSRGEWAESDYRSKWNKKQRKNLYYKITNPNIGEEIYPDTHSDSLRVWACAEETHSKNEQEKLVWWGEDGKSKEPKKKRFLSEHKGANTRSVWLDAGSNTDASKTLREIFGSIEFDNPKPVSLVKKIIKTYFPNDVTILDSFAGSGTTAHATLALNKEDGGNRKFILVEMEDYANDITAERVRRVIDGVPNAKDENLKNGLGGSFTYCDLGEAFDVDKILTGENLPSYTALAAYVFYTVTGQSLEFEAKQSANFFIGETDLFEVYLIYKDDLAYLRNNDSALNQEKLDIIAAHNPKSTKQKIVFATAKYMSQDALKPHNIVFCQIPYAIHKIAGN